MHCNWPHSSLEPQAWADFPSIGLAARCAHRAGAGQPGAGHHRAAKLCMTSWLCKWVLRRAALPPPTLPPAPPLAALTRWSRALLRTAHSRASLQHRPDAGGACRPGTKHPTLALNVTVRQTMSTPHSARPSVMRLAIRKRAPGMQPTFRSLKRAASLCPPRANTALGDDVYVLLTLPDDPQRYPVAGRGPPVTPARAGGNRTQGVGIQFPGRKIAPAQGEDRADPRRSAGCIVCPPDADHLSVALFVCMRSATTQVRPRGRGFVRAAPLSQPCSPIRIRTSPFRNWPSGCLPSVPPCRRRRSIGVCASAPRWKNLPRCMRWPRV